MELAVWDESIPNWHRQRSATAFWYADYGYMHFGQENFAFFFGHSQ
jgi:hypothetical protein